jgi:hypothetical protein
MQSGAVNVAGGIFINYRREDTAGYAHLIRERLVTRLAPDRVFLDVDNIEPGLDFARILSERVGACDALVAIIGKNWLTACDEGQRRRIDDPLDFVRIEIEAALQRDVRVIPVLVDGARMPRPNELPDGLKALSTRQAVEISHTRLAYDADNLTRWLLRLEEARIKQAEAAAAAKAELERVESERRAQREQAEARREPRQRRKQAEAAKAATGEAQRAAAGDERPAADQIAGGPRDADPPDRRAESAEFIGGKGPDSPREDGNSVGAASPSHSESAAAVRDLLAPALASEIIVAAAGGALASPASEASASDAGPLRPPAGVVEPVEDIAKTQPGAQQPSASGRDESDEALDAASGAVEAANVAEKPEKNLRLRVSAIVGAAAIGAVALALLAIAFDSAGASRIACALFSPDSCLPIEIENTTDRATLQRLALETPSLQARVAARMAVLDRQDAQAKESRDEIARTTDRARLAELRKDPELAGAADARLAEIDQNDAALTISSQTSRDKLRALAIQFPKLEAPVAARIGQLDGQDAQTALQLQSIAKASDRSSLEEFRKNPDLAAAVDKRLAELDLAEASSAIALETNRDKLRAFAVKFAPLATTVAARIAQLDAQDARTAEQLQSIAKSTDRTDLAELRKNPDLAAAVDKRLGELDLADAASAIPSETNRDKLRALAAKFPGLESLVSARVALLEEVARSTDRASLAELRKQPNLAAAVDSRLAELDLADAPAAIAAETNPDKLRALAARFPTLELPVAARIAKLAAQDARTAQMLAAVAKTTDRASLAELRKNPDLATAVDERVAELDLNDASASIPSETDRNELRAFAARFPTLGALVAFRIGQLDAQDARLAQLLAAIAKSTDRSSLAELRKIPELVDAVDRRLAALDAIDRQHAQEVIVRLTAEIAETTDRTRLAEIRGNPDLAKAVDARIAALDAADRQREQDTLEKLRGEIAETTDRDRLGVLRLNPELAQAVYKRIAELDAAIAQPSAPANAPQTTSDPTEARQTPDEVVKGSGDSPTLITTFTDWSVYVAGSGQTKICYALSQPKTRDPAGLNYDPAFVFVSAKSSSGESNEVSFQMGFDVDSNSAVSIQVDSTTFDMIANGSDLWVKNPSEEGQVAAALHDDLNLVVKSVSSRGHAITDSYSLTGSAMAIDRARSECQ